MEETVVAAVRTTAAQPLNVPAFTSEVDSTRLRVPHAAAKDWCGISQCI